MRSVPVFLVRARSAPVVLLTVRNDLVVLVTVRSDLVVPVTVTSDYVILANAFTNSPFQSFKPPQMLHMFSACCMLV